MPTTTERKNCQKSTFIAVVVCIVINVIALNRIVDISTLFKSQFYFTPNTLSSSGINHNVAEDLHNMSHSTTKQLIVFQNKSNHTKKPIGTELNVTDCLHHVSRYTVKECRSFGPAHVFEWSHLITLIPAKTGSSFFKAILNTLKKKIPSKYANRLSQHWQHFPKLEYKKTDSVDNNSLSDIFIIHHDNCKNFVATFFCEPSYKKIFVFRDPLTRLLSGYLEKCTEAQHSYSSNMHRHCVNYLLSVGIDKHYWKTHKKEYAVMSKHKRSILNGKNTLNTFIKWLLNNYDEYNDTIKRSIDPHFKSFYLIADLEYFNKNWNLLSLYDANTWDYIVKLMLMDSKLFPYWYTMRHKWFPDSNDKKKKDGHDTHSSSKTLIYYQEVETLHFGLRYTWKDYYIFEWKLPAWICDVLYAHNNSALIVSDFIKQTFADKPQLWPSCVT